MLIKSVVNAHIKYLENTVLPRMEELGYAGFNKVVDKDGNERTPILKVLYEAYMTHGRRIPQHKLDYIIHSHCCKDDAVDAA